MNRLVLLLGLLCLGSFVYADGYWLELKGTGKAGDTLRVYVRYGGVDDNSHRYLKTGSALDRLSGFKAFVVDGGGRKIDVSLRQMTDRWEGSFVPSAPGTYRVLAMDDQLPVVERPDTTQTIRPVQYLAAVYRVSAGGVAAPGAQLFLDMRVTAKDSGFVAEPFIDRAPVPEGTRLRIFNPENWEKLPETDRNGKAGFMPTMKGLYIIRLDWEDRRPGVFKGKRYAAVRHRYDYSLLVE